jgi:outer membrane protein assembly factor BamB
LPAGDGFSAGDWLTYHADRARTGAVAGRSPGTVRRAWAASLGGAVRGQPLVARGRVVAATETNLVVALDPATGRVLWSVSLGPPLTGVAAAVGCGNIDPLGITSTPVVDPATGTVFVVGTVADGPRSVHHQLVGLDLATGKVRVSAAVDPPLPPWESPLQLLQRASLAFAAGRVYVPYGGHAGDCGHYHGWLVGALATDPTRQVSFEVAAGAEGGAIWQSGGAPAVDAQGNVYVSTGNSNPFPEAGPDPGRYSESVVKLDPGLRPVAAFQDPAAGGDSDFGTGNPVLLPDGTLFAVGKTDVGLVLSQRDLGPVATIPGVCGSDPDGGPAYDPATGRVFVPCRGGGIQVVDARSHTLGPRWAGADSAPIVVGGDVWAADSRTGTLTAFEAASGRVGQVVDVGADLPVFTSPSTGAGLLLVGTADGVTAFR